MNRRRKRGRKTKGDSDDEEEKDPMPSVASLVTTPSLPGRVLCLWNIVTEARALWTSNEEELPNDEVWETKEMLQLFHSSQPCFELARLAAISKKNTLCAVLLSKLEEHHEAAVSTKESGSEKEKQKEKDDDDDGTDKTFTTKLLAKVEDANVIARQAIIGFVFDRCSSIDEEVRVNSCEALLKRRKMVRNFIQYCRDDVVSDIATFGQRLLWRLVYVPKGREVVAGYGGGEAMITCFLAWLKRVRAAQEITTEHETDFNFHCNEIGKRAKEVAESSESNEFARKQALRGLKQAKIDFEKTKATLDDATSRWEAAKVHHAASEARLLTVQIVQANLEKHALMLLSSLSLLTVGPDYEMQSVMHRFGVVDCVVDMINRCAVETDKTGFAEMRKQALISLGNFADRFPPIQNTLRSEGLLSIILNELNRPQPEGDSTYTVMVSNVLYKCIDGNSESGEAVCDLGILGGLCRMLHALYREIVHGEKEEENAAEEEEENAAEEENREDKGGKEEKTSTKTKKESAAAKTSRLNQSEASLRVLAECSRSSEARREEILRENVLLPLLTLAATPDVPRIVFVSLKCLGNLIGSHKPTQDTVVQGDQGSAGVGGGLSVFCSILDRLRSEVHDVIQAREAQGLLELHNEEGRSLSENIAFEAHRCLRLVIANNETNRQRAIDEGVLQNCCNLLQHRASDAMRRDACKILSTILGGEVEESKYHEEPAAQGGFASKTTDSSTSSPPLSPPNFRGNLLFDTGTPNRACQDLLFENEILPYVLQCVAVPFTNIEDDLEEEEEEEEEEAEAEAEEGKEGEDEKIDELKSIDEGKVGDRSEGYKEEKDGDEENDSDEEEYGGERFVKPMDVVSAMRASAAKLIGRLVKSHTHFKDHACRVQRAPVMLLALMNFAEPMDMRNYRFSNKERASAAYARQLGARWTFPEGTFPRVRIEASLALAWCMEGTELLGKQQALESNALQKLIMLNGSATLPERVAAAVALERLCHNSASAREDFRRLGGLLPLLAMLMGGPEEIANAVSLITCVTVNNAMNKSELARLGGIPALVRLLTHAIVEHTLQFSLVLLAKHIIMHPEDASILMDTYDGRALPKLVGLLLSAQSSLTLLLCCQIISLCSRGSTKLQLLLLELDAVELLVRMITPPLKIDNKTALFCLAAVTNCAGNIECRKRLKKCGILRAMEALGAWKGSGRDFEHLRRAASTALAACTEPFMFDDGSAEFTQGLIVSDVTAGKWVPWPYDQKGEGSKSGRK